jgi:hypothetical protein
MPRPLDLLKSTSCLPTSFFSLHDGRIAADLPHAGSSAALHQQGSSWAEIGERVGQRDSRQGRGVVGVQLGGRLA